MGTSKLIYVGQRLYVPPVETPEPTDSTPAETPSYKPWELDG